MSYPGGGYPPSGYPPSGAPQGSGYPPPGGYPPSGAPPGSGYPPSGGSGYPPSGGSSYPPSGGSGYPPSGGCVPPGSGYPPSGGYPPGPAGGPGSCYQPPGGYTSPSGTGYQPPGNTSGSGYPPAGGYGSSSSGYPPAGGVQPGGYGATTGHRTYGLVRHQGFPPPNAAMFGQETDGQRTSLAIAHTQHGDIPAKAEGNRCFYPYGGHETMAESFSWVVCAPGALTLQPNTGGGAPQNAVKEGKQHDQPGVQFANVVAQTQWGSIPGKGAGNTCHFGHGGTEHSTDKFSWVVCSPGFAAHQ